MVKSARIVTWRRQRLDKIVSNKWKQNKLLVGHVGKKVTPRISVRREKRIKMDKPEGILECLPVK